MKRCSITLLLLSLLVPAISNAQFEGIIYKPDTSFKVFAGSNEKTIAFAGGFNTPQVAMGDLNHDGLTDLVIYEKTAESVKTFINRGAPGNPDYRYAPEYEANFPPVSNYMKLLDYNCDGIPDLFHRGIVGFEVYKGYYNSSNQLCFSYYRPILYLDQFGWVNAYCDPGDIPAIADVDGDGDLDFFGFSILGARIQYYRNMRVEDGLPCDSIRIVLEDECWGKVYQGIERTQSLGNSCASNKPAGSGDGEESLDPDLLKKLLKTTLHTGNTLCLFDADGDGDMDYLNGNLSYSDIQFLTNGRAELGWARDSIIAQDTLWQSNGHQLHLASWPAAFWLDYDQDGKNDIVLTPHADNASENVKCFAWYRNTGTATNPVFTYQNDSLLSGKTIDVGTGSYPMIYDYDKDGKPDIFIGGDGYFQQGASLRAKIVYYKNTSSGSDFSFTLQDDNFLDIFAHNTRGAYPAVGDLDNDGKDDLVIGHSNGKMIFYKNMAASANVQPNWQFADTLRDINNIRIDSTQFPAPFIYDMNNDGKKDLIIGGSVGWLYYYENVGNANELKLKYQTKKLGLAKSDPFNLFSGYSAPFIGKMDSTGQDFLLMGSNSGHLYRYTGFQSGNVTAPFQLLDTMYSYLNAGLSKFSGYRSVPAIADFDADGKYEMIVGNVLGGLKIYKQGTPVPINAVANIPADTKLDIFPNPAKESITVSWEGGFSNNENISVAIYALTGQKLKEKVVTHKNQVSLSLNDLTAGTYFCVVASKTHKKVAKLVVW